VATQKYKPQKMKVLVKAKLTEEEYGTLGSAIHEYAEQAHEQDQDTTQIERVYQLLMGHKLTGHK